MRGVNFHSVSFPSAKFVALLESLLVRIYIYIYIHGSLLTAIFIYIFFITIERDELSLHLLSFCKVCHFARLTACSYTNIYLVVC